MKVNLAEALQLADMDEIIDSMNAYVISHLKSVGIKNFNGKEPVDFVGDVILKVIEEQRDWSKAQCSFKEFLFGCLKSEISNFFKTNKNLHSNYFPDISSNDNSSNIEEKSKQISELLKQDGADDEELTVFEYWMDGIFKPATIASDLGISVKEIYNIIRRIDRRLPRIQKQAINII